MNILKQYEHMWKATYKRGEGTAIIYANSEEEAKKEALAHFRKQKMMVNFYTVDDIVAGVEFIS